MVMAGNSLDPSGGSTGLPRADRQVRQERTGGLIENKLIASRSVRPGLSNRHLHTCWLRESPFWRSVIGLIGDLAQDNFIIL